MTEDRLPLAELLAKAGDGDFLRTIAESVMQLLMEADVEGMIGAGRHERTLERATYRNGYRDRSLDTRLGSSSKTFSARKPRQAYFATTHCSLTCAGASGAGRDQPVGGPTASHTSLARSLPADCSR